MMIGTVMGMRVRKIKNQGTSCCSEDICWRDKYKKDKG